MMGGHYRIGRLLVGGVAVGISLLVMLSLASVLAANPGPQSGSLGLEGTISTAPPNRGATIAVPGNGAVFMSIPITISGLCPNGLLIKIFDKGIFVGSTVCSGGAYSLQIDLFSGQNDLVARDYDALDQTGPDSAITTVTFNDAQFLQYGNHISITSNYAENGAQPGTQLSWPIQLSGGTGPFAISVNWGDGSPQDLMSIATDDTITLKHIYKVAGIYNVVIKAVDKNGETAFLQLVGQATGAVQNNKTGANNNIVIEKGGFILWPMFAMIPLIFVSFWIGKKYENQKLRGRYFNLDR
jgi:hypothetical protein